MRDEKEKILTVTINDCEVQTFKASGAGGQKRNKTSSAVRVIHHPSGARAESSESRSQYENKRTAFIKMVNSIEFRSWLYAVTRNLKTPREIEEQVEREIHDPRVTITEVKAGKDRWKIVNPDELVG